MTATPVAELDAVVRSAMTRWNVPGLTFGMLRGGVIETSAFGVASIESGQPVQQESLFQAGSISKIFTTTLVMQLVDEGLLDLDAPILPHYPSLRLADGSATARVTMRHLLTHTAGFYGDRFEDYGGGD